ncbi:MAG: T9SS type A sorting domain-containing protein, partial [Ignavibacteriota bacterium]
YFYKKLPNRSTLSGPVFARKVSSNGAEIWDEPKYLGNTDSLIGDVSISIAPSGFIGIWDTGDSSTVLRAQMMDANGKKIWSDNRVQIGSSFPSYRFNPHQDRDHHGDCIACWNDSRNKTYPYSEIYCAKIDTTGFLPTVIQKYVHTYSGQEISVRLYPNPAQTFLSYSISDTVTPCRVRINDELGRQLWEGSENSGKIDIRSFSKGTYFLSVESQEKVEPIPFIIF